MKKMLSVKGKISVFYLPIYITMASLIAFSIYCYLIIDKSKRKHSLSFRITNNTFKIFSTGSNNKLKVIDIENRMCYCFDDIMRVEDTNSDNLLLNKKSYENVLIYKVLYKTFM